MLISLSCICFYSYTSSLIMILSFCRIQYLLLLPRQSPIRSKAQSLLWGVDLLLWLNWCLDRPR
jgi:hypothetical protein